MQLPQKSLLPSISMMTLGDMEERGPEEEKEGREEKTQESRDKVEAGGAGDIPLTPELVEEAEFEEANDDIDTSIETILQNEPHLPKDVGEINVQGHLRFDEEMPPDAETKDNTIFNALMYHIQYYGDHEDHVHHHKTRENKTLTFDTYSPNIDVTHYQTTMIFEDRHFKFQNTTRTFLVPFDENVPSVNAVNWTLQNMVDDNDILVVLKVVSLQSVLANGVGLHRKHCKGLLDKICKIERSGEKKHIKIIVEIRIGSVDFALARGIKDFDPTYLVMGTRGIKKAKLTNFLNEDTSLTKHFVDNGRVPVIVLNPLYETPTAATCEGADESYFTKRLTSFPSVYDPVHAVKLPDSGRTSRFLRIGKSMSRSASASSLSSNVLSPVSSNNELTPTISGNRALSPRRTLSPFRLFHSRH